MSRICKCIETENRLVAARGRGRGEGKGLLIDTKFLLGVMKMSWD